MRLLTLMLAAVLLVAATAFLLRDLPPPRDLTFAAGPRDGGYWAMAERYRAALERDGITLEILETAGSVENAALLAEDKADVGLLQGGIPVPGGHVEALGSVFIEPILIFARGGVPVSANPGRWQGLRIARGAPGSGTRVAVTRMLDGLGVSGRNELFDLGGRNATAALLAGEVDLAIFVADLSADYLQPLVAAPDIIPLVLEHTDAVALRVPHSRVVTVPSGAISLDPVIPGEPLSVVALVARLAAADLHPAVVDRLVMAAREIHGGRSILAREGDFPTAAGTELPIDPGALKLLLEGQSAFHEWLPYWIAAQIRRVLLVLVPLLFLVIPLVRSLPGLYRWSMRRRVWKHYTEIRRIEVELAEARTAEQLAGIDDRLDRLDQILSAMRLPPPFRESAYNARLHVDMIRRQIVARLHDTAHAKSGDDTERGTQSEGSQAT